jgi:hypothetical protein
MTGGIQTFADNRQTYKHYINSLKHVYKVLKLAKEHKKHQAKRISTCSMLYMSVKSSTELMLYICKNSDFK